MAHTPKSKEEPELEQGVLLVSVLLVRIIITPLKIYYLGEPTLIT